MSSSDKIFVSSAELSQWSASEIDGSTIVVSRLFHDDVLVDFDNERRVWVCSEDGLMRSKANKNGLAPATCVHVMAATRRLPLAAALRLASQVAGERKPEPKRNRAADGEVQRMVAESLAKGAEERERRARQHDEEHRGILGQVVVRREDPAVLRSRLAARRARKRIGD